MSEPELVTHDAQQPAPDVSPSTANHAGTASGNPRDAAKVDDSVMYTDPPAYFTEALDDAERLLKYAAEMGIEVDDNNRNSVLEARAAVTAGWSERIAANLLAALTKLAALLKPVTAESLRSYNTRPTVRTYWMVAICLAIFTVPFSVASFVASAISKSITTDIATANDLAVKLTAQFQPFGAAQAMQTTQGESTAGGTTPAPSGSATKTSPPLPAGLSPTDAVTELQTFASQIRAIYARSRQLNYLILRAVKDPFTELRGPGEFKRTFQLPVPLPPDLAPVVSGRVLVYQDARSFGQDVVDDVSVFYGATTTCILPVLYALLGTCAYLLRSFSQEMSSRTFVPSHSDSARFLIAAIVGGVVGLFNNFTVSQAVSIPPLAIAFVVGYAVDVFFSFLEGLIQAFSKAKNGSGMAQRQPAPTHKS